jgi:electron transfer flavoprotein alpha subunit
MEKILFLTSVEADGSLAKPAFESLSSAKTLAASMPGSEFLVGLFGSDTQAAANQLATCGAVKFLSVAGPELAQCRYSTDAAAIESLVRATQATLIIAPATSRLNRVLPGVAQRFSGRADTHVAGMTVADGTVSVNRWYYRQRMEATLKRSQRPWFILIDPGSQAGWNGQSGTAQLQLLSLEIPDTLKRTTVLAIRQPAQDAQTIRPDAKLLLVAGAGWTKKQADGKTHEKEAEQLIRNCLTLAGASLGSSKSLVDLGGEGQAVLSFLTHMNQVGQTGSTPRHPKGLATCCHGEEPHTVGWRFITERRAINLDPGCGWARGKADVLYVADAFAVIGKLNELLAVK